MRSIYFRAAMRPTLLLVATVAIACAPPAPKGAPRNRDLITQEELVASRATNLYDAIHNLRPTFLRSRGRTTFGAGGSDYPAVYLDGQRYGEIQALRSMSIEQVRLVRFLSGSEATIKYGTNHTSGVIEVVSR